MKTFALLTSLLLLSLTVSLAQELTLKPKTIVQGSDTLRCFDGSQYRELARELKGGDNCAEQIKEYQQQVDIKEQTILEKNRQVALLKTENYNSELMYKNEKHISDGLMADKASVDKKLKRQKKLSKALAGVSIILAIVAVVR